MSEQITSTQPTCTQKPQDVNWCYWVPHATAIVTGLCIYCCQLSTDRSRTQPAPHRAIRAALQQAYTLHTATIKQTDTWQVLSQLPLWRGIHVLIDNKVKIAHTRLPSVGFRSWSRFLAVSLQVTWVINPTVGCHYFTPGLQLPLQPLRGLLPISLLGEQKHDGCEQFA